MINPGSTIGIIGGGQLGRMMAVAAADLGYKVYIFTPASHVDYKTTVAEYTDSHALQAFAQSVDVVTFEFENVPHESLLALEEQKPVRPSAEVLRISRNRIREKNAVNTLGIGTAPFREIRSSGDMVAGVKELGLPAILKTAELGYDGKGQVTIKKPEEAEAAFEKLHRAECILEGFVEFAMEISVIVARGAGGETKTYVPVQNIHKNHILDTTLAPAPISETLAKEAEAIAVKIATALNVIGLLAVEMFVTKDNKILVNELAPRPHNSGHWTMDACITGQFEQIIRAVCGLSLGNPARHCDAEMKNLIGDDVHDWEQYLKNPNAKLHLYGKAETREGRKMGHVNILKKSIA
jgi:5-(carboxyamino)imidazole ribonucleotide synthase